MKAIPTAIEGVIIIEPSVFKDERGYFLETYNPLILSFLQAEGEFRQDNESYSSRRVLRGLHFQNPPYAQGKLVRAVTGAVLDVAVDIREGSPHYGKWVSVLLSSENKRMLWIPPGFAHGFVSLQDDTIFSYKCTAPYNRESEGSIRWNDPDLAIQWDVEAPIVSDKDGKAPLFREMISRFQYQPKPR